MPAFDDFDPPAPPLDGEPPARPPVVMLSGPDPYFLQTEDMAPVIRFPTGVAIPPADATVADLEGFALAHLLQTPADSRFTEQLVAVGAALRAHPRPVEPLRLLARVMPARLAAPWVDALLDAVRSRGFQALNVRDRDIIARLHALFFLRTQGVPL